jgi:putative addiction module CopG family antidote
MYDNIILHYHTNMSTISVPLPPNLEEFIEKQIREGKAENKAQVVRQALRRMSEEEAIEAVLRAEREVGEGKVYRGDLRKIMKKFRN